jgi:oxygen-independent coproporphyrinogen-3 oxidase
MDLRHREIDGAISTIYLGGGTPSQLSNVNLRRLFDHIQQCFGVKYNSDMEITMECNPDDVNEELFNRLPVNRVSMGIQTFDDARLRFLHRRHSAAEARHAVEILRRVGIQNISIDLMFGFPEESLEEWESDIDEALALKVEHISAYGLMFEEGTLLYNMLQQGKVKEIDEEISLKMYDMLIDKLRAAGYEHYEISNFALPGYRSRHNSSYWNDTPYVGLGAAAHSYDGKRRSWNVAHLMAYMSAMEKGERRFESEKIDKRTHYDDMVMTSLRTCEGLDLSKLDAEHRSFILQAADSYIKDGKLEIKDGYLRLTRRGIAISNLIMSDLMDV